MTSDPWNKKHAHVDWSDAVEEELQHGPLPQDTSEAFPSLDEAAKTTGRQGQRRRKERQQHKISLHEFISGDGGGSGVTSAAFRPGQGRPLTDTELMMTLPTAPRKRDPNEPPTRNWGGRQGYPRGGGGYDRDERERRPRERDEDYFPSRADESANWGADRRGGSRGFDRPPSRGSSRGYDERETQPTRDYDNWSRDNRFQPSQRGYEERPRRGYGFHSGGGGGGGGGFAHRYEDRWNSRGSAPTPPPSDSSSQGRPRLNLSKRTKPLTDTPEIADTKTKSSVFGDAKPREEVLRERGTSSDVYSSKSDIASDQDFRSQPGSPGGSYRGSSISGAEMKGDPPLPRPKPREDPFGGAKPREVVLNERLSRSRQGTPSSLDQ